MNIIYEQATEADCQVIADLLNVASDGMMRFLFHDLVPNASAIDVVASILPRENPTMYYKNVIVARADNEIAGMVSGYAAEFNKITPEMRDFIPKDRLDITTPMFESRVEGSFYLESLAVYSQYRGYGIATELINLISQRAEREGFDFVSLHVADGNPEAKKLYDKLGFVEVKFVKMQIPGISNIHEGMYLLQKSL